MAGTVKRNFWKRFYIWSGICALAGILMDAPPGHSGNLWNPTFMPVVWWLIGASYLTLHAYGEAEELGVDIGEEIRSSTPWVLMHMLLGWVMVRMANFLAMVEQGERLSHRKTVWLTWLIVAGMVTDVVYSWGMRAEFISQQLINELVSFLAFLTWVWFTERAASAFFVPGFWFICLSIGAAFVFTLTGVTIVYISGYAFALVTYAIRTFILMSTGIPRMPFRALDWLRNVTQTH
jgi:hypothetical protein